MDTSFLPLDPLAVLLACGALVIVFVHAAWAKLSDRSLFEQHLAAYGVPDAALPALVWALPLAEAAAALGLVTPWRGAAATLGAALLVLYAAAMAWHRAQGHRLDCGCGGAPLPLPLSWALVVRNLGLAVIAALAAAPVVSRELGAFDLGTALAGLLLATLLYTAVHQVLRQSAAVATWRG